MDSTGTEASYLVVHVDCGTMPVDRPAIRNTLFLLPIVFAGRCSSRLCVPARRSVTSGRFPGNCAGWPIAPESARNPVAELIASLQGELHLF
jgi:hypothetical protein